MEERSVVCVTNIDHPQEQVCGSPLAFAQLSNGQGTGYKLMIHIVSPDKTRTASRHTSAS
jgi:hypothetical protein